MKCESGKKEAIEKQCLDFTWQVIPRRKLTIKSQSLQYHAWFAPDPVTHPLICDCSSLNLVWMTRWAVKGGNLFWSTLVWRKGKHGFCGRLSAISSIYSPRFARASNSGSGSFSGVASLLFSPSSIHLLLHFVNYWLTCTLVYFVVT